VNSDSDREMIEARLTDHQILRSHGQSPIATSVQQLQSNQPQSQQLNRLHIQRPVQQHFNQQQQHQQLQPPNRHQHYQQSQHSNTPLRSHNNHQRVLNESVSNNGDIIDTICTQLLCPDDKVSQLIGKKGSILRELKKISNCEISIERVAEADSSTSSSLSAIDSSKPPAVSAPQVVHISGSRADVLACVQLVNEVIELGPVIALKMQTKNMIIPHDKVPLVIGQRGITAKEMMRRSGCKIHVNETVDADDNCFIELTGTSEQLSVAEELISHVLEHGTKALGKRFQK
jgi:transcription antitermination factor NusA-like protein